MTIEKDLKMYLRHGLKSGARPRTAAWHAGLCLAMSSCLISVAAHAQTGTGKPTQPGTGNGATLPSTPSVGNATGLQSGSRFGSHDTSSVRGGAPGYASSSMAASSSMDPELARQDQHGMGTGAYGRYGGSDYSWIPYTRRGYVGISLGRSDYDTPCGLAAFSCEDRDTSVALYTGGMFNDFLGLELGLKHFGNVDRAGGEARAYGGNIRLVGAFDMQSISLYGKVGAIYGRTKISADPLSGVSIGTATAWGPSATLGIGFNVNRNFTVSLERSRDRFDLAGGGRTYLESTDLALRYRF